MGVRGVMRSLALLVLLALPLAAAVAQSTPRAAEHDGFGRMVFDWDGPVQWSADLINGQLVVRFDKPVAGDPKALLKPLSKYVKGVTLSPDRRIVSFPLAAPVQVKSFLTGSSVVVDLVEAKAPPAPAQAVAAPPPAQPAAQPASKPAEPPTDLMVRGGEHTGFNRLVFDWPKPVGYTVDEASGRAVISFDHPATLNVVSLKASLPPDVEYVESRPAGKGTAIVLSIPAGMRVRHFTSGSKVAVDLVRPAGAAPPPRAVGVQPPPLAPAPGAEEQPAALQPLGTPPQAAAVADAKGGPATEEGKPARTGKMVSLGFPFEQPTGAAVFRRAGWLWVVFDHKSDMDTKLLKRTGGDVVLHLEQVQGVKGTAVRLITRPGFNPSVRKDGQLWVLDLAEQPLAPKAGLDVRPQMDFQDRGRVVIAAADGSPSIQIRDPEVGDFIQVVTLSAIGSGVRAEREYPGVQLLATAQGIAAVFSADGVRMDINRASIEVTTPGGLFLSRDVAPAGEPGAPTPTLSPEVSTTGPLDIDRWLRGGNDKFYDEHKKLLGRLAYLRPEEKNSQRLEIARHFLANGFGAEALGELRVMAGTDPQVVDTPAYRAVRGAANFLMNRDADAVADLSLPALKPDSNVQLFLAAALARSQPEPTKQALVLRLAGDDIKGWPRNLRMSLGPVAAKTVAAAGDAKAARKIVDAMVGPGMSRRDVGAISYLAGLAAEANKQYDEAASRYRDAEESESRPDRAYAARARVEMQLRQGKMTPAEAIRILERLRFAWRGEDFEYQLMKRLGQLQIANAQYGEGLRSMHALVSNYGDNPDVPNVVREMGEAFSRLFLDGEADKLPAVTAIGLYDEFQELTPTGARGDEMIRRLADRLAAVDLLDRSAELLRHQVNFRLSGQEKAKVGARVAFLNISDRKPGLALESLDMSEVPDIPAELAAQRRYLRVQALDDLGRSGEALALIINDPADEARRLRADIYWRLKKWPEAAAALESLVEKPDKGKPLDAATAGRLLDLATALTLAKDERGLTRLRRTFAPAMASTELHEAFDLLTSEPERGIIDYRRVGEKIKQVKDFQNFMGEWRKKVKTQGLSSIN
jgi:hypothetical protein